MIPQDFPWFPMNFHQDDRRFLGNAERNYSWDLTTIEGQRCLVDFKIGDFVEEETFVASTKVHLDLN